jgi:hypothetical protein
MTLIGKLLAFVNLIVGLGILSWSVSVYTQRPYWFGPIPDSVGPRQNPESFAQMKAEIDALVETAKNANGNWGTQRKILEDLEKKRIERRNLYEERLNWARNGNPKDGGNGFYEPVYEKDTGLLDLTTVGAPIKGSDNLPLKGSEKLLVNFQNDVNDVVKFEQQIVTRRKDFEKISKEVTRTEERLRSMTDIRDSVQAEKFFLETFEVNVYETRETVFRRKKQLVGRLAELGMKIGE